MALFMSSFNRCIYLSIFCFFLFFESCLSHAEYAQLVGDIHARIDLGKKVAIFIIDMQPGFIRNFHFESQATRVIDRQARLISEFESNDSVFFVDVNLRLPNTESFGSTFSGLRERAMRSAHYKLWEKEHNSAFDYNYTTDIYMHNQSDTPNELYVDVIKKPVIDDDLHTYLGKNEVEDIVPVGCFSEFCVFDTTDDALELGYSVIADRDLMIVPENVNVHENGASVSAYEKQSKANWSRLRGKYPEKLHLIQSSDDINACVN